MEMTEEKGVFLEFLTNDSTPTIPITSEGRLESIIVFAPRSKNEDAS